ncbi:AN1-type zinc finger protein 1-like [Watersipora subatra]|uniref:AN1-type zinc finger protein 1-like n=1 Tax=Watersipora subatra TaxID=2589382 RepID=UPI00355ADCFB
MAELDIGKHCSLASCKQLDFLPFICDGCGLVFCKEHQVRDKHSCDKLLPEGTDKNVSTPYRTYQCSLTDCGRSELVPVTCDECHLNYCMMHRHGADHACSGQQSKPAYMSATAQHVQTILDSKESIQPKVKTVKSKKAQAMAAKVALMKLKQTATGDAGVPMESRVYLSLVLPIKDTKTSHSAQSAFWLDKEWTVGRSVDYISSKSNIKNDNNRVNSPKLRLIYGEELLSMEHRLKELLESGSLYNGSTVELRYVTGGCQ